MYLLSSCETAQGWNHGPNRALLISPGNSDAAAERRTRARWHHEDGSVGAKQSGPKRLPGQSVVLCRPSDHNDVGAAASLADDSRGASLVFDPVRGRDGFARLGGPAVESRSYSSHAFPFMLSRIEDSVRLADQGFRRKPGNLDRLTNSQRIHAGLAHEAPEARCRVQQSIHPLGTPQQDQDDVRHEMLP
jgi:hypothetical protein